MNSPAVMVVDDDEALRESICEILEEEGFQTIGVESGAAALGRLRSAAPKPDLILLDLMMPVMNGWEFRDQQLADPELGSIPVVVLTASRDLQGIQVDEVVYKPIKLMKLVEVVRRHTGGALSMDEPAPAPFSPAAIRALPGQSSAAAVFSGGGELGRRMAAMDWSATPLGPVESWPQSLRTCVRIILTSRQPMFVWWGEDLINLYNDAYKSIVGGKHPGSLGQPASVVWREIWGEVNPRARTAMQKNEGTYDEALLLIMERHGYQEETYYTFSYSPVPNDQGGTGGIICANTDDTQRIIGERQLTLLRELARRTADARTLTDVCRDAAGALATSDRDLPFALLYLQSSDRSRFELSASAGLQAGCPVAPKVVALEDASIWPLGEVHALRETRVVEGLARFGALPGGAWDRSPSRAAIVPITRSGDDGLAGVLVVGLNPFRLFDGAYRGFLELVAGQISASITNARAYEQERKRAEALAEVDRAKTTFFSNVSHEFRTPLTLMLGPTQDLLSGLHGQVSGAQREQLEILHRNGLRLQKLVNALLDFSRLEAGRVQASYEPVDLPAITREIAGSFRSAIERAGLSLEVDCPPLPAAVFVDREMWEKIVLNLLSNALKFTFEGKITLSLRAEAGNVVLRVADTGVGIAAHELPRVFERFHRIEGTRSRTFEGSGIGLALVQELARLHGGSVGVESTPDVGTTFSVSLPESHDHLPSERIGAGRNPASISPGPLPFVEEALRWLPEAAEAGAATLPELSRARAPSVAPAAASTSARILLADDNADMRDYVRRHLERLWRVDAVADGIAALAAARENPPDLILTDIMMPGLDGFQLLRELRLDARTRDIPVVMLSARAGEEAKVEGLHAGAEDYLTKPFAARELEARVRTHLELSRLRKQITAERQRLYELFMQAPLPIYVVRGPELVFEMANARYLQLTGRKDLVGKTWLEALPEARGQGFDELMRGVIASAEPFVGNEVLVRLDRERRGLLEDVYFTFIFAPIRGADGAVDSVMAVVSDVTEQVLARRVVEESEERFRRLVTQVQAGIAELDPGGRFTLVNDRYREITGRAPAELRQLRIQDVTHPEDQRMLAEALGRLLELGTPCVVEMRYVRPDGSIVWVQNSVARLDDGKSAPTRAAAVTIDITQRKFAERVQQENVEQARRAEEAQAQLVEQLQKTVRYSEMFVGILGHDLRNPLNAIVTAAGLLELRADGGDKVQKPARRIATSAARMERMISQLLDFTHIRIGGGLPLSRGRVDLGEISRAIADELEPSYRREIRVESRGDVSGVWDRDRLSQLLSNLAANACQHGSANAPIQIALDGTRPESVVLEVHNQGIISAELLPALFEPLRHAAARHERRDGSSGLGLGLYITQQIAIAHGGNIRVESGEASGTRFVVELPRGESARVGRAPPSSSAEKQPRPS